ncbi:hypothetical protein ACFO5R_18930 [Halosolutus amylolyticus]|uniref:Uncharacterized protein n=1 Tax=Halosolutus amylolyticus TaxID=2932267 RepID=A0ABD5PTW8_9EURY|nr:hypothetical protein [Halosolutus amylolyticus]
MTAGPTVLLQAETALTPEITVVFAIVTVVLALFVLEPVPVDVTALGLLVTLVILEPWTGVTSADGLSEFASSATLTVLAMFTWWSSSADRR